MNHTDPTPDDLKRLVRRAANKERRILSLSIVFSLIAVVIGVLWLWYAYHKVKTLDDQYASLIVTKDAQLKEKTVELDQKSKSIAEKQNELAQLQNQRDALQKDIQDLQQFFAQVQGKLSEDNDEQALRTIDQSFRANEKVATLLPRVYIQINDDGQRAPARRVVAALQQQGFLVPNIQNVNRPGSGRSIVRYYRQAEENEAARIVEVLRKLGVNATAEYKKGQEDSQKMRPRHYDLSLGTLLQN